MRNKYTDDQKKICFVIDVLGVGGAEQLMVPILACLKEEFDVRVCVFRVKDGNPIAGKIRSLGISVDLLPIQNLKDITALPRLIRFLKDHDVDMVHTQLEFADILGNMAAKILGLPSISTFHTMPPIAQNLKKRAHQWLWLKSLNRFCDRVISVSEEAHKYYLKTSGVSLHKTIMIHNGIDFNRFSEISSKDKNAIRQKLSIPKDAQIFTTVAVLRAQKGIQFMIQAMPAILAENLDVYYLVVGSGPHLDALKEEARALAVEERVIFTGMRTDVPQLLSVSDIFILPTLTEALPTVLAEAMAARCPIIASAVGGVPEMVINGENGYLVDPENSDQLSDICIRLLKSQDHRETLGNAGWEIANQKFNIHNQIKKLKVLYLELIP